MSKLKKINQIDGKAETFKATTLEQIWGDTGLSRYKTFDTEEYKSFLADLNKSDLQSHAASIGVLPSDSREKMIRELVKAFQIHVNSFRSPNIKTNGPKDVSKKALDILSEGR